MNDLCQLWQDQVYRIPNENQIGIIRDLRRQIIQIRYEMRGTYKARRRAQVDDSLSGGCNLSKPVDVG